MIELLIKTASGVGLFALGWIYGYRHGKTAAIYLWRR